MNNNGSGNVLIASHGLSISALLAKLFEDEYKMPEGGLKNASVCTVKYKDGKYILDKVNDLSYVEKAINKLYLMKEINK